MNPWSDNDETETPSADLGRESFTLWNYCSLGWLFRFSAAVAREESSVLCCTYVTSLSRWNLTPAVTRTGNDVGLVLPYTRLRCFCLVLMC
jgi:hypothetical protein